MDIRVQSVKFNARPKLLQFVDKKVGKLGKFYDGILEMEVVMTLFPDKKAAKIIIITSNGELRVERDAATFEDAIVDCVDVLKLQLGKIKGKEKDKEKVILIEEDSVDDDSTDEEEDEEM